ncbi:MAG: hypothetical protein WCY37_04255 [Candidatus Dojkabacteria bacterium]
MSQEILPFAANRLPLQIKRYYVMNREANLIQKEESFEIQGVSTVLITFEDSTQDTWIWTEAGRTHKGWKIKEDTK